MQHRQSESVFAPDVEALSSIPHRTDKEGLVWPELVSRIRLGCFFIQLLPQVQKIKHRGGEPP
ncbi:MAG: hypothetical protein ONB14_10325, partial [candidate division KSB1 bacterium]|nr:hypothetical protein [candidate division KSB1 bacterium]